MRRGFCFSIILTLVVCAPALAYDWSTNPGDGSAENPYQISEPNQLNAIGSDSTLIVKCFILMNDIDMSEYTGTQYNIIEGFRGTFDGDGHAIQNLTYTGPSSRSFVGLFGRTLNAEIRNLGIENVHFSEIYTSFAGGLIGSQVSGLVTNCYSTGFISFSGEGYVYGGGLVGNAGGTISKCFSTCTVNVSETEGNHADTYAGGLVGGQGDGLITDCYSTGAVNSEINYWGMFSCAGGIVGYQFRGTITNCYSTGQVTSSCPSVPPSLYNYSVCAGGLVGRQGGGAAGYQNNIITNSYSIGSVQANGAGTLLAGGLVGEGGGVINCFWDSQTSGLSASAGGCARTTAQLKQSSNYIAWNTPAESHWTIQEGTAYPRLTWENQPGQHLEAQVFSDFISGNGTENDPYQISTPQQLIIIGLFEEQWDKVFCLNNDIDLSGYAGTEFNRIGVNSLKYFAGTFDGNGHTLYNLTYSTTGLTHYIGVFGFARSAVISNLNIENANIFTGGYCAGGLLGYQLFGTVHNCHNTEATVVSDSSQGGYVGGLVGYQDRGSIFYSSSTGTFTSSSQNPSSGGIVGYQFAGAISDCCTGGTVTSSISNSFPIVTANYIVSHAGGLVGYQYYGSISNCYSAAEVNSSSLNNSYAGGLVGFQNSGFITNCYSTGIIFSSAVNFSFSGGLIGYLTGASGGLMACYWDTETSETNDGVANEDPDPTGVAGLDDPNMMIQANFVGWNFVGESVNGENEIWRMCVDGVDYPRLSWEFAVNGDFACGDGVDILDLQSLAEEWLTAADTSPTTFNYACDGNGDKVIDLEDYSKLAENW